MSRIVAVGLTNLLLFLPIFVIAADDDFCIEFIRHAAYNYYVSKQGTSNYSVYRHDLCQVYEKYTSGDIDIQTAGNYLQVISGKADLKKTEIERVYSSMCSKDFKLDDFRNSSDVLEKFLDSDAVAVMKSCADAAKNGVITKIKYSDDNDKMVVDVYFDPGRTNGRGTFADKPSLPDSLKCEGPGTKVKKNTNISSTGAAITCDRKPIKSDTGSLFLHPGGTVVIYTSGGPILASLPPKPKPSLAPKPKVIEVLVYTFLPDRSQNVESGRQPALYGPRTLTSPEGKKPSIVHYEFKDAVAGKYNLKILYQIHMLRPVLIVINGKVISDNALGQITEGDKWETIPNITLNDGENVLEIKSGDVLPHIKQIVFEPVS